MKSCEIIKEESDVLKLKSGESTKAKEFVDMIRRIGYINPLDSSMVILYSTGPTFSQFELTPRGENTVRINFMQAYPLRSGAGTKGMEKLQKLAAKAGITLEGDIWDKGPVKPAALKKFYQKMGFTVKGSRITWTPPAKVDEANRP